MKSYADFHLHTIWSDGEDTPKELLNNIINNNVKYFSITDHDTIRGNIDFYNEDNLKILKDKNIKFITGIEVSSILYEHRIHLLGFDYDINSKYINNLSTLGENLRKQKTLMRIDYILNDMKINLSKKSIDYLNNINICAKPHFAKCFYEDGYAESIMDAMKNITNKLPNIPCLIDADLTIDYILKAGGIPVWAHPLGGINEKRLTKEQFLKVLKGLISLGLKGLECYYSLYTKEEIDFLVSTAKENNLLISIGSDYHGKNVKKVTIGEVSSEDFDINFEDISILDYINSKK